MATAAPTLRLAPRTVVMISVSSFLAPAGSPADPGSRWHPAAPATPVYLVRAR
jgi:hypothetical protein